MNTSYFSRQNIDARRAHGVNVGTIMKRRLVWFESLQDMGQLESESWEAGSASQQSIGVDKLRNEDLSRLKRAVISDPVMRSGTGRGRTNRDK